MVWDALDSLAAWLCQVIYPLISYAYKLFYNIGTLRIINNENISPIYNRITLILGLVMLFVVIFQLIQYIMEPDNFTDKEKGFGKVMYRMILSVILIALVPKLFDIAFEIQSDIMSNNIIPNIVLGSSENYNENWGGQFSASILEKFYGLNPNVSDYICKSSNNLNAENVVNLNLNRLSSEGKLDTLSLCINDKSKTDSEENIIKFDGLIAVISGVVVLWMLVMYCLDLGTRVVQLTYLQIIAPIPIIMYMLPKKDGAFEKWVKQCLTTFLDLFIRTAIICFVVLIISTLSSSFSSITSNVSASGQGDKLFTGLLYICLVLGVMTFAKKAGDMLKELFPKGNAASGELGLSTKNRIPEPAKRIAGAGAGFAVGGVYNLARRTIGNTKFANQGKKEKAALNNRLLSAKSAYNDDMRTANDTTKSAKERNEARMRAATRKKEINNLNEQLNATKKRYSAAKMMLGTAGTTLLAANKGMVAGLTTKGGMGGVGKTVKTITNDNKAYEEWRENGGTSSISRTFAGIEQAIGISPLEAYEKKKEKINNENTALSKVTDNFGKAKDAIEKDIDEGKCDSISENAKNYRLAKVKAETATARAGNLKKEEFSFKTIEERNAAKDNVKIQLQSNAEKYRKEASELKFEDFAGATEAEKKANRDKKAKELEQKAIEAEENAKDSTFLDKIIDKMCQDNYDKEVSKLQQEAIDAQNAAVKYKKEAVKEISNAVINGGIKNESGEEIYNNAKAEQLFAMVKDAANTGSSESEILANRDLNSFEGMDSLNKEANTRQNDNASELYKMEQSPEYKAAQANKKYNESGKK